MKDVRITVDLGLRRPGKYDVTLQLDDSVTCGEILQTLVESLTLQEQEGKRGGRWQLVESWRGCERAIPSKEQLVPLYYAGVDREEVKICLKRRPPLRDNISYAKSTKCGIKYRPTSSWFSKRLTRRRLCCLQQLVQKELQIQRKKYRDVLYKRLAAGQSLWTPREMTQLDILQLELGGLRDSNLKLSSQVADLNITSTNLRSKLNLLRQKSITLSDQLSMLEEEVKTKKELRERQGPKNMAQAQTELIKLRRELDVRNRLNTTQTAKLEKQKERLREKQQLLSEKKKELEITKSQQQAWSGSHNLMSKSLEKHSSTSPSREFIIRHTPSSAAGRREPVVSSASKKRHSSIFEVKTRQLVEEESKVFRKLHAKRLDLDEDDENETMQQSTNDSSGTDHQLEEKQGWGNASPLLTVNHLPADHLPTDHCGSGPYAMKKTLKRTQTRSTSKRTQTGSTSKGRVQFTEDSIILNVALEGELDLLKECTRKLGSCLQSSDKGATCLHNAVCSGNINVVSYLVEQGCDVNAQDIDGWTPLHCAVAYRNLEMIQYLVYQGASLFLTTKDGDTPIEILAEDYRAQKENKNDTESTSQLVACLDYLQDLHKHIGHTNDCVVYTIFSRKAKAPDELAFTEGEQLRVVYHREDEGDQWCLAENIHGRQGLVPLTFLGPYRPPNLGTLL